MSAINYTELWQIPLIQADFFFLCFFPFKIDLAKEYSKNVALALLSSASLQNYFCGAFLVWNSRSKQKLMTVTDNKILTFSTLLSIP